MVSSKGVNTTTGGHTPTVLQWFSDVCRRLSKTIRRPHRDFLKNVGKTTGGNIPAAVQKQTASNGVHKASGNTVPLP